MSTLSQHTEWLSLIDVSGPFLAIPVLERAFPQGLDVVETRQRQRIRQAYDEWRDSVDVVDPGLEGIHQAWLQLVLEELLEFDSDVMKPVDELPESLAYSAPEHGVTLKPDFAVLEPAAVGVKPRLLISTYPPETDLEAALSADGWPASAAERMTLLCRATGVRLGLITDGERWMLVDAPVGVTAGYASWYARLWSQEPITLRAFQSLLGLRRFFGPEEETLEALLENSLEHQEEVTDKLGEQVRRAVEVLVQALDRADIDRNRELLDDVTPPELYEAGLTVMMRLVFLLCAEERGLLLLGDPDYDQYYAISPLRAQLREEADRVGLEVLERRQDAWSRLLAVFRAVYGGIEHESLRMPALGGSLFDPDRFPFLEGRDKGTSWLETSAIPLPIDNHTVLMLLDALQVLEQRGGAQLLSYRALDVEQIGYIYEGLLEHTVSRVPHTTLGLVGSSKAKNPNVELAELESASTEGEDELVTSLVEKTGRSKSALTNALKKSVEEDTYGRLLLACTGDRELADRIRPFAHLLRADNWGQPLIYKEASFAVTAGAGRRETGTHYTPKSLTEAIVGETLVPVAYVGPAMGEPRENWKLISSKELLDLKICDPAMGSAAFLVQACRWLSERVVEAWLHEEQAGKTIRINGKVLDSLKGSEPLPRDAEERLLVARRLIAERCLYGVDINPLAVELAKLSIWLVTLAKGRPFGFLDHNLRAGDSLLGIYDLDQLRCLDMDPTRTGSGRKLFAQAIDRAVDEAVKLRKRLRQRVIRDIHDIEIMVELDQGARRRLELPELIADTLVGEVLANGGKEVNTAVLAIEVGRAINGEDGAIKVLRRKAREGLSTDLPSGRVPCHPMHWPLEFPEVFVRENGGFDAIVGNPPFLGGQRITGAMGTDYRNYLVHRLADGTKGSADLVAYFFLQAHRLLRREGDFGLLAVNTIAEGDTRKVGLERLVGELETTIYAAYPNEPWPGKAAVVTSRVYLRKGAWKGSARLSGREVPQVSAFLSDQEEWTPKRLVANAGKSFQGSIVLGMGFVLTEEKALDMIEQDPTNREVLFPYLNGKDLNTHPEQKPSRWVINFWDWPEEKAREYEEPYRIVLEKVKPERQRRKPNGEYKLRKPLPQRWWHYGEKRPALYHAIGRGDAFVGHTADWDPSIEPMGHILTCSLVQNYLKFAFVPNNQVYAHKLAVFSYDDYTVLALLSSSIHQEWARKTSSTMRVDINYSPSDSFLTFPFPETANPLCDLGKTYNAHRDVICADLNLGLTKLYNRFHDIGEVDLSIQELRNIHHQIDEAVVAAYGWNDLDLEHGFHEVYYLPENDRVRFTISDKARIEVLWRLSLLNKERYEEEVAQGLHSTKKVTKKKSTTRKKQRSAKVYEIPSYADREIPKAAELSSPQMDIFTGQSDSQPSLKKGNQWGSEPIDQILAWLEAHPGWHGKQAILSGCQADRNSWDCTIEELLEDGFMEVQGEGGSVEYRATS